MLPFSPALFRFLEDLSANNDRTWFAANKGRFEAEVKAPLHALVHALAPRNVTINLADVPRLACGESKLCAVRDVWAQAPAGTAAGYFSARVAAHDSVFVIFG